MEQRIVIVDLVHLLYNYMFSKYDIQTFIELDGRIQRVSTKIHAGVLRSINKWSRGGKDKIIVCIDNCCTARKNFIKESFDTDYNGCKVLSNDLDKTLGQIINILKEAGIELGYEYNYEAKDLIFGLVQYYKKQGDETPIDIVTADTDLLPLVDEQVSVFLRSQKFSYAVNDELLKQHYVQITPENFEAYVTDRVEYRGYDLPYNSVLLHKLLRGNKSANIPGLKGYGPKKYNELLKRMQEDGVEVGSVFKYGEYQLKFIDKETGLEVDTSDVVDKSKYKAVYKTPIEFYNVVNTLEKYLSDEELNKIKDIYKALNLNQPYMGSKPSDCRLVWEPRALPRSYEQKSLIKVANIWNIKIKLI